MNETRFAQMQWTHPHKGEIVEVTCDEHKGQVLTALKTLGIGCTGRFAPEGSTCDRCAARARGVEARYALGLMG